MVCIFLLGVVRLLLCQATILVHADRLTDRQVAWRRVFFSSSRLPIRPSGPGRCSPEVLRAGIFRSGGARRSSIAALALRSSQA